MARLDHMRVLWRLPAAWRLLQDPAAKAWEKALVVGSALYVALPADLIPDVVPFAGWADDLGLVAVAAWVLRRRLRKYHQETQEPVAPR